ncbi:endospore germination permease [Paenibacillus sp. PL2-23]|uniref:GerAB/ArcD/ProY family transporter n=1 Tax=Paenibacillus sp. PL2-23 TaxID=2100729 RepID=UPI0030F4FE5E
MEIANGKISIRQFQILIVLATIGDSILILPTITASAAKQDAWLVMLVSLAGGLAVGAMFAMIANRIRGEASLGVALGKAFGSWIGAVFLLLLTYNFFMCGLTLLSAMSHFMNTQLMPETPVNAIVIVFLTVIIIACRYGVEAFARMAELLFPVFFILLLLLLALILPQADWGRVEPIAAQGMMPILRGTLTVLSAAFLEMVVLLTLVPHVVGTGSLTKPILKSFALGGLLLFAVVLLCVLVLGPNLMESKYYPTFVLAQKLTIGNFLERMEAIIAFVWIITVFYKTLLLFCAVITGVASLLKLKDGASLLSIPVGMIMMVLTVVSTPNITEYNYLLQTYYHWFDLTFCLLVPALLLTGLLLKGRGSPQGKSEK